MDELLKYFNYWRTVDGRACNGLYYYVPCGELAGRPVTSD